MLPKIIKPSSRLYFLEKIKLTYKHFTETYLPFYYLASSIRETIVCITFFLLSMMKCKYSGAKNTC